MLLVWCASRVGSARGASSSWEIKVKSECGMEVEMEFLKSNADGLGGWNWWRDEVSENLVYL